MDAHALGREPPETRGPIWRHHDPRSLGQLLPEVIDIVDLVSEARCILGTGHLSPEEVVVLAEYLCRKVGAALLVTHPEWSGTYYPIDLQKKLASYGNVMFERCFVSTTHRCGYTPFATIEKAIADIGVDSTVLSTDLGQPDTPRPSMACVCMQSTYVPPDSAPTTFGG